jgi:hypothetical protein
LGAYNLASTVKQKEYEAKLAQQNAKFGGMAQLGGAGIAALGPKAYTATTGILPGMFGGGATAAGTPAAAAAPTVAADIAGASSGTGAAAGMPSWLAAMTPGGLYGAAPEAGTVAADLAAAAPAATGAAGDALAAGGAAAGAGGIGDMLASAGLPEWLASFLPFLAAA